MTIDLTADLSPEAKAQILEELLGTEPQEALEAVRPVAESSEEKAKDLMRFLSESEELFQHILQATQESKSEEVDEEDDDGDE